MVDGANVGRTDFIAAYGTSQDAHRGLTPLVALRVVDLKMLLAVKGAPRYRCLAHITTLSHQTVSLLSGLTRTRGTTVRVKPTTPDGKSYSLLDRHADINRLNRGPADA